ncbi:hypothetical protein MMA231_04049 (plasmid) [Asticcacaulis sp. MM231]
MAIRFFRIDPGKSMARLYELDIQTGLFGDGHHSALLKPR